MLDGGHGNDSQEAKLAFAPSNCVSQVHTIPKTSRTNSGLLGLASLAGPRGFESRNNYTASPVSPSGKRRKIMPTFLCFCQTNHSGFNGTSAP